MKKKVDLGSLFDAFQASQSNVNSLVNSSTPSSFTYLAPDLSSLNLPSLSTYQPPAAFTYQPPVADLSFLNIPVSPSPTFPSLTDTFNASYNNLDYLTRPDLPSAFTYQPPVADLSFLDKTPVHEGSFWQKLANVFEIVQPPLQSVVDMLTNMNKADLASDIAKSVAETQKAAAAQAQAIKEAQTLAANQQSSSLARLASDAWKKSAPYAVPIAVGLAIVSMIMLSGNKKPVKLAVK